LTDLSAQSNPSWWKYAPPEASAIVGIQWRSLASSVLASTVAAELAPGGAFGFPDVALLRNPDQVLIGSPAMLAIESGTFPIATLRAQAAEAGLKRTAFKGTELWVSSDPAVQSIAYVNENLILVGGRKILEDTIRRITNPNDRSYSPLLARAARYSKEDLWVVAARLPDPLASLFVPLEIEATAFEGSVSIWDGLHLVAAVERSTPTRALDFADSLAAKMESRPEMADATEISTRERSVLIRMDLDERQLAASLRTPTSQIAAIATPVAPAKAQPKLTAALPEVPVGEPQPQGSPQTNLPPPPPRPRVVRIVGLESGPREIPLGQ
jgi:hypothetical protein